MDVSDLLLDGYGRVEESVSSVLDGLTAEQASRAPQPGANPIGWLVWHLTRVQDDHVTGVAGGEQVWTAQGFDARVGLPYGPGATGYGQSADEVAAFRADPDLLAEYHRAVAARTRDYLRGLSAADLDRVVDDAWDPPVTLGVRLISVLDDDAQHVGQAAYARGLLGLG